MLTLVSVKGFDSDFNPNSGWICACYNKQIHFSWEVEKVFHNKKWEEVIRDFHMQPCDGSCHQEIEPPPAISRIIARIERRRSSSEPPTMS